MLPLCCWQPLVLPDDFRVRLEDYIDHKRSTSYTIIYLNYCKMFETINNKANSFSCELLGEVHVFIHD